MVERGKASKQGQRLTQAVSVTEARPLPPGACKSQCPFRILCEGVAHPEGEEADCSVSLIEG
jgi:hypothetical protein